MKTVVVSISPQSRASIAASYDLSAEEVKIVLYTMGELTVCLDDVLGI